MQCRWASFYLIAQLLESISRLSGNMGILPIQYWLEAAVYVTGLIVEKNVTATAIAESVGLLSHDRLTRMLRNLNWGLMQTACMAVWFIETLGIEGYLVIDDVLIPKPFAKMMEFCGWDWDHSRKCNTFGQRLVFVIWSNGRLTIPLIFAFWQKDAAKPRRNKKRPRGRPCKKGRPITDYSKKARQHRALYKKRRKAKIRRKRLPNGVHYRSKNELARCLIWLLIKKRLRVEFVLFDNWYASRENIALFERLGLKWATKVKDNARVTFDGRTLTVKQLAAAVAKANYHYYGGLQARAKSFQVDCSGSLRKLTVIKDDSSAEGGSTKYLMTNDLSLTNQQHIQWYRRRWIIEVFFRDAKQELGLCKCEARTQEAIVSHAALVCLAYTILQLLKPKASQQRPSVRACKNAIAPIILIVRPKAQHQLALQLPSGLLQTVSLDQFWLSARTRLPAFSLPENLGFL